MYRHSLCIAIDCRYRRRPTQGGHPASAAPSRAPAALRGAWPAPYAGRRPAGLLLCRAGTGIRQRPHGPAQPTPHHAQTRAPLPTTLEKPFEGSWPRVQHARSAAASFACLHRNSPLPHPPTPPASTPGPGSARPTSPAPAPAAPAPPRSPPPRRTRGTAARPAPSAAAPPPRTPPPPRPGVPPAPAPRPPPASPPTPPREQLPAARAARAAAARSPAPPPSRRVVRGFPSAAKMEGRGYQMLS